MRPALGLLKVAAVTRQDMDRFHAPVRHAAAGELDPGSVLQSLQPRGVWGMRADGSNPCSKIERYPENHRERFLSAEELGRLGATLRQAETVGLPWKASRGLAPKETGETRGPPHPLQARHHRGDRASYCSPAAASRKC